MIISLLGAESTGKTQLAHALADRLNASGRPAIAIDEYLREWCDAHARTPRMDEQAHIAQTQRERIEAAARMHETVIADTTPLMTALYSEFVFGDKTLYPEALAFEQRCDITLLTGLDMPWVADGIQRDGEHVRGPVDALLRQRLQQAGRRYQTVYGTGEQRLLNALDALNALNAIDSGADNADSMRAKDLNDSEDLNHWIFNCEKCSDPECEHRLFSRLALKA
jgi:nicotinamide riboside kinase